MQYADRLLRRSEVCRITGMTKYMINMLEDLGHFPKRMRVGQRAVFWSESEIFAFIEATKRQRVSVVNP